MKLVCYYPDPLSPCTQMFLSLLRYKNYTEAKKLLVDTKGDSTSSFIINQLVKQRYLKQYEEDISKMVFDVKAKINVKDNIFDLNWLDEYRSLFKGKKPGSTGDPQAIRRKMVNFLLLYPDFADKDLIIRATKRYIKAQEANNYTYLMQADYFICKNKGDGGQTYTIAAYCEEEQSNVKMIVPGEGGKNELI
jgi:hypothetical protein